MPIPFLALLALQGAQTPIQTEPVKTVPVQQSNPVIVAAPSFDVAPALAEPKRLEISPKLDGKLDVDEWDPLSTNGAVKSFLQWEPNHLFVAGVVPVGQDLLVSVDFGNNGWLVGRDNLEVRVSLRDGKAVVSARLLDATAIAGPSWVDLPGLALAATAVASSDAAGTSYELSLDDAGFGLLPTRVHSKFGIRVDGIASSVSPLTALAPRVLTPVELVQQRAAALPTGLNWNTEGNERPIVPGEPGRIRVTFNTKNQGLKIQKLEMRTEWPADDFAAVTLPFPGFDNKGRAYVDYSPLISPQASIGYRVLRTGVTGGDGITSVLESSYRVAPLLDVSLVLQRLPVSPKDRAQRMSYILQSNSLHTVGGEVTVVTPEGYKVLNGDTRRFGLYGERGNSKESFLLLIPANAVGTFPVKFLVTANGQKLNVTSYLTIAGR